MFNSLSKRERFLVYLLFLVVLAVLFQYLLLMPALHKNSALKTQLNELSSEYQLMKISLENSPNTIENLANVQANLKTAEKGFTPFMQNEDIDRLLCGIARQNGLKTVNLAIKAYHDETANEETTDNTLTETTVNEQAYLKVIQVSLAFTGNTEAFWKFLDAVQKEPYLLLQNAAISKTGKETLYYAEIQLYMPTQ